MSDLTGHSLGRYQILEQLGQGGMATVYKAYDTRLERDVAVKVLRTDQFAPATLERILKRFEREARALAKLTHPNIVGVIDYGEHEGAPYLVMEYLPGGTLKQRLGKPMPWQDALRLLLPIADALNYAHQHNILHRDVKPSNILLTENGQPMLTDFGIAKILDLEDGQTLTATGVGVGTPEYMSPEQGLGKPVDARTDVYSLGIVLYELVTGRKPFQADTPMAVVLMQATEPLPRPTHFVPDLPEAVEKLLLKALAKQPQDRYASMAEMAAAMERIVVSVQSSVFSGQSSVVGSAISISQSPITNQQSAILNQQSDAATIDQGATGETFDSGATVLQEETIGEHLARAAAGNELTLTLAPGVTMTFVRIPAGPFQMGSPKGEGDSDEHPQHEVYLDEYWMGKTPVTNRQYEAFVRATGREAPGHWKKGFIPEGKEEHPVVYVSWHDAVAFCEWLSRVSGETIRLPSEAEWEKAARGTDGRRYPWGNEKPSKALCNYASGWFSAGTTPVGKYSPQGDSPYGCVDMAGNVWEWMNDWYDDDYYSQSSTRNPPGPASGEGRVLRGGAWSSYENYVRAAYRGRSEPGYRDVYIGFRCSRSP